MILIKPFESRDQEAVRRLILAGLAEHWGEIDPGLNPDLDDIAASYEDATFLVAWLDGRIVGSGALVPRSDEAAEIVGMSVVSELRGRGIGQSMLNRLCQEAAEAGFRRLVLETTSTWEDVIEFYKRFGFRMTHTREGPFGGRGPPRTRTAPGAGAARFMKRKILLVVSTRPNFMKVAPILARLRQRPEEFDTCLVHTGQHYDALLSDVFFDDLDLPAPDHHLGAGSGTHGVQTGRILAAFDPVLIEEKPDLVVVVGDVTGTMACALGAVKLHVPVAHVEAGLRSRDRRMPEEINRIVTDAVSDYLFTPSRDADANLRAEGIPAERIHCVGNVMVDSLRTALKSLHRSTALEDLGLEPRGYALLTLHRDFNVDSEERLRQALDAVERVQRRLPVVFPVHPRTRARIESFGLQPRLAQAPNLRLIEPVGYLDALRPAEGGAPRALGLGRPAGGVDRLRGPVPDPAAKHRTARHRGGGHGYRRRPRRRPDRARDRSGAGRELQEGRRPRAVGRRRGPAHRRRARRTALHLGAQLARRYLIPHPAGSRGFSSITRIRPLPSASITYRSAQNPFPSATKRILEPSGDQLGALRKLVRTSPKMLSSVRTV